LPLADSQIEVTPNHDIGSVRQAMNHVQDGIHGFLVAADLGGVNAKDSESPPVCTRPSQSIYFDTDNPSGEFCNGDGNLASDS